MAVTVENPWILHIKVVDEVLPEGMREACSQKLSCCTIIQQMKLFRLSRGDRSYEVVEDPQPVYL